MEAPGPLRGAQPLVDLQKLLADVFDNVLGDFIQLSLPDTAGQGDRESTDQRKYRLLQHLHGTRQQLLRALALLNWKPWKVLNELVDHDRVLDIAASHVRTMTEVVQQMRQQAAGRIMAGAYLNMYDVNTALEVLTTGTYQELPSIILQRPPLFQPPPASLARQRSRLAHVTQLIRARLVQVPLPPGLKVVSVSNGTAVLRADGLYDAKLTLVPSEPLPSDDGDDAAGGDVGGRPWGAYGGEAGGSGGGPGYGWATAAAAAAAADPVAAAASSQRWKWRLIHFVLAIGVPFYDPRQPGQILNTCNFHMVLAADNAAYLHRQRQRAGAAGNQQQPPARGAPGQDPAHSTLSESAATPVPSGFPQAGAAAAAAAAAGGSLAAAVRRAEDDEVGAPLAVMHAILTDVAGRLLADELAAAARALAAPGSRWHGHIAVKTTQLLHPGVRIEYWTGAPPLLSQRALPLAGPGEEFRTMKPGPPYLELGMGEGGCVEVLHSPSSLHKPVSVSKLRLDTFRVNVEEVLMRAANMSAQFQLLQIRQELKANLVEAMGKRAPTMRLTTLARQLWCRDGHVLHQPGTEEEDPQQQPQQQEQRDGGPTANAAGGLAMSSANDRDGGGGAAGSSAVPMDVDSTPAGATVAARAAAAPQPIPPPTAPPPEVSGLLARVAPPEEAAGALVLLNAPVLEYLVSGTTELKIGKHLFSGRLTLRPGQDERDEGSLDHAATIATNEDYVNQAALTAYNTASADGYPAWRALKEACNALCHVLQRTHTSTDATHFIQAARRAALHISRLPHGMLEAFTAASPGLAIEARPREKVATWALQCVPFPTNFPPLELVSSDTLPLRVPQCLTFFLQSRLSLSSPHVLVVCSCNKQLMPIRVLSCIPVPPSTYRLPDHVVAAYMAASTAGHGGGGAAHGNHPHSVPQSGASSPRAAANGLDGTGRSPDASPRRDSTGGVGMGMGLLQGRPSVGGGAAASAVPSGPGSEAGAGGGATGPSPLGLVSGMPSLPSASSPPQHSHSQGRVQSSGTAASGTHPQRSSGGSVGGAGATGRPTGQQVAVMLAQQQLSSVVRWCRRRMVWEVLLVQLQAVGATFEERCNPPCQRVRVTRVAGTALPCPIARRRGLTPARVGPTCLELELGPDPLAGHVTARLYGRFLCSPACAPVDRAGAGGGRIGRGGGAGASTGFVLDAPAAMAKAGATGDGGVVCLRRQYCLERGDSALTIVQEVCAVIRMQTLLARLEMTARGGGAAGCGVQAQRLAVLAPPPAADGHSLEARAVGTARPLQLHNQQQLHSPHPDVKPQLGAVYAHRYGQGGVAGPPGGMGGGGYGSPHAAKRIKTEPGVDAFGNGGWCTWQQQQQGGLANGGHVGGAVGAVGGGEAGASLAPGLTWHWPLVGTLTLEDYSCSAATIRVSPCTTAPPQPARPGAAADAAAVAASAASPLQLHITWAPRDVRHLHGNGAATGPGAGPGSPAQSPSGGGTAVPSSGLASPTSAASAAAGPAPSPFTTPTPPGASGGCGPQQQQQQGGLLPPDAVVTTTRPVLSRTGEVFGSLFSDMVLCTVSCSSGHSLPPEYLHVLEEFAEAGEEGKLLDAMAVAAWPLAGFCSALRPAVLARHGLTPDMDVRLTLHQPPYCHRIVCRRRGNHVLIDLVCQAVGRSYIKVSLPSPPSGQPHLVQGLDAGGGGGVLERQSTTGGPTVKTEPGAGGLEGPSQPVLQAVQQLAPARLGSRVHVSVGGKAAVSTGLGHRPAAVPGPGSPLWLLVPNDCVQQAVELVYSVLH